MLQPAFLISGLATSLLSGALLPGTIGLRGAPLKTPGTGLFPPSIAGQLIVAVVLVALAGAVREPALLALGVHAAPHVHLESN